MNMNPNLITRRDFFTRAATAAAGTTVAGSVTLLRAAEAPDPQEHQSTEIRGHKQDGAGQQFAPGLPWKDYTPVITPNNVALPFKIVGGIKIFHLVAEEVPEHEFAGDITAVCMDRQLKRSKGITFGST